MSSRIHAFDAREGGYFRISLAYEISRGTGKTSSDTDTYHGTFVKLVPDEQVIEEVEFETEDPRLNGKMTITYSLVESGSGTELIAIHDNLPPGLPLKDNELGWTMSLAKLAALVEGG